MCVYNYNCVQVTHIQFKCSGFAAAGFETMRPAFHVVEDKVSECVCMCVCLVWFRSPPWHLAVMKVIVHVCFDSFKSLKLGQKRPWFVTPLKVVVKTSYGLEAFGLRVCSSLLSSPLLSSPVGSLSQSPPESPAFEHLVSWICAWSEVDHLPPSFFHDP